jgi:site-specific recombinase XerD
MTLDQALTDFLTSLRARNVSSLTEQAYATDIRQFISWLGETTVIEQTIATVSKTDILEYLAYLADFGRSGITRARKLASLRELFKYLVERELIPVSPAASVAIPKKSAKHRRIYDRTNMPSSSLLPAASRGTLPSCNCFSKPAFG